MKRLTLLLLILLACQVDAFAQHRVYIERDYTGLRQNLYVVPDDNGNMSYCVEVENWDGDRRDTVYLVMNRAECISMNNSLKELLSLYKRWTRAAKANKVRDYSRPMVIDFPSVVFEWRNIVKNDWGEKSMDPTHHRSSSVPFPQPTFVVDKNGNCEVVISTWLLSNSYRGGPYPLRVRLIGPPFIKDIIRRTNVNRTDRAYKKLHYERQPDEYYDSIFK